MKKVTPARHKVSIRNLFTITSFIQLLFGIGLAILSLKGFILPNHFLDGGVTGISLLVHEIFHINLSALLVLLNAVFVILAYKMVSREVAIRSSIAILVLSLGLEFINIHPITSDKLLISIFGGLIIGIGMGLVVRSGSVIDGSEIIAVLTTRRISLSMGEVIAFINILIFLTAAVKFGIDIAMYSIITYFAAAKIMDYIIDGLDEYTSLTIICKESERVKSIIVNEFEKGVTIYKGERGFLPGAFHIKTDCDIIVTIVTRLEVLSIKNAIAKADPTAFMYVHGIKEVSGGVIKQKNH